MLPGMMVQFFGQLEVQKGLVCVSMPEGRGSLRGKLPGPQSCLYWGSHSEQGSVKFEDLRSGFNLELDIFPV